ncbi:MAG: monofunctional biosynthetic peptidoglycan transglycosylase [Gammaproteobacteria bacterium]
MDMSEGTSRGQGPHAPKPRARKSAKQLMRELIKPLRRALLEWLWRGLAGAAILLLLALTSLRWFDPFTSAAIVRENRLEANRDAPQSHFRWRDLDEISRHVAVAVIAAEDQRFFEHYGLDFVELFASLTERGGRLRGASTITQQVVKNLFLWRDRSYLRKLLELPLALYIDLAWGKRRVLEIYLNIVQFGPHLYGIENASQYFFGKPALYLTRHESARLVSVLPNPQERSPMRTTEQTLRRQRRIMRQMRAIGGVRALQGL